MKEHELVSDIIKVASDFHAWERKLFNHHHKKRNKMTKQYQAIEPTINAAIITSIEAVTTYTATLDDGTTITVTAEQASGDAVIYNADGTTRFDAATDFAAHYTAV